MKKFNIGKYLAKLQARTWLSHALCMPVYHTAKRRRDNAKNIGTIPGARRQGRPHMAQMDNIKTWTGLPLEESIRMTEDRDKWRKYVHGVANPQIEDG